jgi:hypothetical protein
MSTSRFGGFYLVFYWLGVALAMGCLGLALAGNGHSGQAGIPLSWQLGGAAILAFLAAEFGCPETPEACNREEENPQLSAEWEAL